MAATTALRSVVDIESFIHEYFDAWGGTDEDRIMSYYAENVTVQIPGTLMQGRAAVREQFVRPFITGFPGNRHVVRNWIFGRDVVVVEWSFEAEHTGPFEGRAATNARVEAPGCGVYEYDPAKRQIRAARIYLDMATLLKQMLDQRQSHSRAEEAAAAPTGMIAATGEHLDLATVIAVSQTVSGEMVLEKLLDTLMRTAVEHARAERALLILSRETGQWIAAEATTSDDTVMVRLCDESVTACLLPESVLRYVLHARESVILDDAAILNPFSTDPYIAQRQARSVLCLPLMNQAKFIGVLYLENNLAPRVFAPARSAVLKLLASQAAISLENTRLYRDLAERESRIRRLVDANIIGILIWELEGRIVEANDAFLGMVGYDREDLVAGRLHWTDLTPPEWRDRDERRIAELKMSGTLQPFEKEYFHKDGSRVPVLIGVATFEETGNRGVAYVLDLTERKQAENELRKMEQELRRAQRLEAMGALAGGIAHDFNNILGAMVGYGEMALRGAKQGTRLRRDLDAIMSAGERGRALVDRILAFSRSGVGERAPVHVEGVVREVLDQLAAKLPENVTIAQRLRAGRAAMLGDSTQVHQVVMNLTNNAVQAMPEGGVLCVTLEAVRFDAARSAAVGTVAPGDYIVLKVNDAGTGIAPEVLEHMFDPFFTTKEVGVGSGLGLSLVHGIVTSVGGAIDVATELGRGSTFTVYFPRCGEAAESRADEDQPLPRGDGQRVLIVDDEEPLARLASDTLEELGYVPVAFTSSARALEAFDANPDDFDAILTDERMPGVSGSAIIREVRRISPSIPIVLMSGFVGAAAALNARELGASDVLRKPLLARDLATSLARVLVLTPERGR